MQTALCSGDAKRMIIIKKFHDSVRAELKQKEWGDF